MKLANYNVYFKKSWLTYILNHIYIYFINKLRIIHVEAMEIHFLIGIEILHNNMMSCE